MGLMWHSELTDGTNITGEAEAPVASSGIVLLAWLQECVIRRKNMAQLIYRPIQSLGFGKRLQAGDENHHLIPCHVMLAAAAGCWLLAGACMHVCMEYMVLWCGENR